MTARTLTAEQVVEGRRRAREGETITAIAAELDVNHHTLRQAIRGKVWAEINDIEPPVPSSITRTTPAVIDDDEDDDGPRHGTERGALAHIHEGTPPCEPCAAAAREATEAAYRVRNAKEVRRARAKRRADERHAAKAAERRGDATAYRAGYGEHTHRAYLPARPRPSTPHTETRTA